MSANCKHPHHLHSNVRSHRATTSHADSVEHTGESYHGSRVRMHMRASIHVTGAFGEWWHPAHHLASPPFGRPPSHGPLLPPPVPTKDHAIQIIELRLHRCTLMPPHHSSHHHVLCVLTTPRTIEQHPLLPRCALAHLPSPSPDPTPPTSASASIPRSSAGVPHPVRAVTRPKRLALDGVRLPLDADLPFTCTASPVGLHL
jgi:hypothetical protein